MRYLIFMVTIGLGTLVACDVQPCDRYVDYMCACHDNDPDVDCNELQAVLADAGAAIQDQCAIDLADQQDQDEADGLACDTL